MAALATETEARDRAQFMLRMRQRGVGDVRILRALERTPRSFFVAQRYADIAARDIALPIGGGQTAPPPSTTAAMIEALRLEPSQSVLEIGAGSGYAAALLGQLAARCVDGALPVARGRGAARLAAFGLDNVRVLYPTGWRRASRRRVTARPRACADRAADAAADALARARRRAGRGDRRGRGAAHSTAEPEVGRCAEGRAARGGAHAVAAGRRTHAGAVKF